MNSESCGLSPSTSLFLKHKKSELMQLYEDQKYEEEMRLIREKLKGKYSYFDQHPWCHPNYEDLLQQFQSRYRFSGVSWTKYWEKCMDEDYYEKMTEAKMEVWKGIKRKAALLFNAGTPPTLAALAKIVDQPKDPSFPDPAVSIDPWGSSSYESLEEDGEKVYKVSESEMRKIITNCINTTRSKINKIQSEFGGYKDNAEHFFVSAQRAQTFSNNGSAATLLSGAEKFQYENLLEEKIDTEMQTLCKEWKKLLPENLELSIKTNESTTDQETDCTMDIGLTGDSCDGYVKPLKPSESHGQAESLMKNHSETQTDFEDQAELKCKERESVLKREFESSVLRSPALLRDQSDIVIDMKYLLCWINQLQTREKTTLLELQEHFNPKCVFPLKKYLESVSDSSCTETSSSKSCEVASTKEKSGEATKVPIKKKLEITEGRKRFS